MTGHLRANLWMLVLSMLLCSVLYPLVLLGVGQTLFPEKAQGSLVADAQGNPIGSRLIAQSFTAEVYFQPRPSAVSYNGAASGASNWAASNYALRNRVARQLGPIVKYASGAKRGQPAAPDIQRWFQQDQSDGKPGIVAQWASQHPTLAQNWVNADTLHAEYVAAWRMAHADEVSEWVNAHPNTPEPTPEDLAVPFFTSYSRTHPGTFPATVERKTADGGTEKVVEPVREGIEIQATFFEMWLEAHPGVDLQQVPADMVMASGSGLDPHITLDNALWQSDRVAAAWAKKTGSDAGQLHREIEQLLREKSHAPLGGLVGVLLVNVFEVNLALRDRYQKTTERVSLNR